MSRIDEGQFRKTLTAAMEARPEKLAFFDGFDGTVPTAARSRGRVDRRRKWYNLGTIAAALCVLLISAVTVGPNFGLSLPFNLLEVGGNRSAMDGAELREAESQDSESASNDASFDTAEDVTDAADRAGAADEGADGQDRATDDELEKAGIAKANPDVDTGSVSVGEADGSIPRKEDMLEQPRDQEIHALPDVGAGTVSPGEAPDSAVSAGAVVPAPAATAPPVVSSESDIPAPAEMPAMEAAAPPASNMDVMLSTILFWAFVCIAGILLGLMLLFSRKNFSGRLHVLYTAAPLRVLFLGSAIGLFALGAYSILRVLFF